MTKPSISVVIPFYGYDEYLPEAINSLEEQTYQDFEIVIVDDCSPGKSVAEILSGRDLSKITILRHQHNLGPSAARNTAVSHARGELILPFDADDILAPTYLERTLDAVTGTNYAGAYTDLRVFGDQDCIHEADWSLAGIMNVRGGQSSCLFKKEVYNAVGGYKTKLRVGEDKDFWLSALAMGFKFVRVPEPLLLYRTHEGSLSSAVRTGAADVMIELFNEHREFYIERIDEWFPLKEKHYWEQVCHYRQLYKEWESGSRNYLQLEAEWKKTHELYLALERQYNELAKTCARPNKIRAWLKAFLFG